MQVKGRKNKHNDAVYTLSKSAYSVDNMRMDENEYRLRLGEQVRRLRKEKHLSQFKLASLIGYDQGNVCRIEKGAQGMLTPVLLSVCNALEVSVGEFMQMALGDCSEQEKMLIKALRVADPGMRQIMIDVANAAISAAESNKHAIEREEKAA